MITLYRADVERIAPRHHLPVALVVAVCEIESSGNRYAWNPEPRYRWFWDVKRKRPFRAVTPAEIASKRPPADFPCLAGDPDQEWWAQQASWGLMQVMGAVAREYGFQEPYIPQLCEARYGIEFGCSVLAHRLRWADDDVTRGLAAYNAGTGNWQAGRGYAAKVLARRSEVLAAGIGVEQ